MVEEFIDVWNAHKEELRNDVVLLLDSTSYFEYSKLVEILVKFLSSHSEGSWRSPDFNRITEIDDGSYEGTLIYVVGCKGEYPNNYWATSVEYGSCSGCDTLERILESGEARTVKVDGLMTLLLHLVQKFKKIT